MIEHDHSQTEPDDDELLRSVLSQLRHLEPPVSARIANRAAIAAELQGPDEACRNAGLQSRQLPWWRRSIAVPVPLAACVLALVAISLPMSVRAWQNETSSAVSSVTQEDVADSLPDAQRVAHTLQCSVSEKYLCGVGRLSIHSQFNQEYTP